MTERFVHVRRPARGTGRRCMHCGRPATVTAERVIRWEPGKVHRLEVRYCDEHATRRGVTV